MGVWADFGVLSGAYYHILDRYFNDFLAPGKRLWCKMGEEWCGVEVTFYDCEFDVLRLVDNSLCDILPSVRLVYEEYSTCPNIGIMFSTDIYYGFELTVRFFKDAYFRFYAEEDEEGNPLSFHVEWKLAVVRGSYVEGEVLFDNDPSEEEAVKAIISNIKKHVPKELMYIKNVDDVVRVAVKIVGVLAKYMSRRVGLFNLFP